MPKLMSASRDAITRVIKTKLNRKDQIKSKLIVLCTYEKTIKEEGKLPKKIYNQFYHPGKIWSILSEKDIDKHITLSAGEIDKQIDSFLNNGLGWKLIRIEMLYIETYLYRRATGGSYIPTSKNLANTKYIINPVFGWT